MSGPHRDYEPFGRAENMEEDLGLFESIVHPHHDLPGINTGAGMLVVTDQSNQDASVRAISGYLSERTGIAARHLDQPADAPEIIARANGTGLIVLPVPCGEDITGLATQSLGSIADSLLQTWPGPILCVRQPFSADAVAAMFAHLLVAISRDDEAAWRSLAWSFLLASRQITLLEWVDREAFDEAHELLKGRRESRTVEQAVVGRAVNSRLAALVGAAQRGAVNRKLALQVDFRLGSPVREILSAAETSGCGMLVLPRPVDHTCRGYHLVADVLLASAHPVLVV